LISGDSRKKRKEQDGSQTFFDALEISFFRLKVVVFSSVGQSYRFPSRKNPLGPKKSKAVFPQLVSCGKTALQSGYEKALGSPCSAWRFQELSLWKRSNSQDTLPPCQSAGKAELS
jgi:hypothetical protein